MGILIHMVRTKERRFDVDFAKLLWPFVVFENSSYLCQRHPWICPGISSSNISSGYILMHPLTSFVVRPTSKVRIAGSRGHLEAVLLAQHTAMQWVYLDSATPCMHK